jgi:twitching motility protein PilT
MFDIDKILEELVARDGSDLHLKIGRPPLFRLAGDLVPTEYDTVTTEDMDTALKKIRSGNLYDRLQDDKEADDAYEVDGLARFRVNAFQQRKQFGVVMRRIPWEIPTIEKLGLPAVLKDIAQAPQGMVLVTGATGSGKSTTLASMINYLNETEPLHIITIEDPVEFVYGDKMCTINQRQLGMDTGSLHEALKRALRQDPDVILMGEMRDRETIEFAMHAAETGHLVFSTLHTNDAKQTIDRIIDTFPGDAHNQIRQMLSLTLKGVISQRLMKRADGNGRVAAQEIMINAGQIKDPIAEGKTGSLDKAIANAGSYYRMQTFNQALAHLVSDNQITEEEALDASTNPGDLKLLLRGFTTGTTTMKDVDDDKPAADAGTAAPPPPPPPPPSADAPAPPTPSAPAADENKPKITRGFKF